MLKTPQGVQKEYGIESSAGRGRAIPRTLFAYKGKPRESADGEVRANPDKFDFLVTHISMIMSNALPQHGQRLKTTDPVAQEDMARRCGLRRETFTRRVSKFAPLAEGWDEKSRAQASERARRQAEKKGLKLRNGRRQRQSPRVLISRQRGYDGINRYNYVGKRAESIEFRIRDKQNGQEHGHYLSRERASERASELDKQKSSRDRFEVVERPRENVNYYSPTLQQLLNSPAIADWWDPEFAWDNGSYKDVCLWLWDERLRDPDEPSKPLGDIPRLVATYYMMKGLMDFGEVHPWQDEVAAACGISPKSVYLANCKLAKLGGGTVFRIVPQRGKQRADGTWEPSKPTMILYLPMRQITPEDAEAERQRYLTALAACKGHGWDITAAQVHDTLLAQWEGTERQWRTFYRQLATDLAAAGIPASAIQQLMPAQPPG